MALRRERRIAPRLAAAAIGVVFGFTLAWSGLAEPDVIRRGLLFEDAYLFLLFFAAMLTATVGLRVLRRTGARAVVTGEPVAWERTAPERRHVVGSVLFGAGWSISAACPGPIAAQLGLGVGWSLATASGVALGVSLALARARRAVLAPGALSRGTTATAP